MEQMILKMIDRARDTLKFYFEHSYAMYDDKAPDIEPPYAECISDLLVDILHFLELNPDPEFPTFDYFVENAYWHFYAEQLEAEAIATNTKV